MTVTELKTLNNLTSNLLSIGQKLKVVATENTPANQYIVVSGDSLYSIAKRYGISVDELKQANGKTSNLLSIGEVLVIPDVATNYAYHTIVPGDTLYGIARAYNTTVNAIMNLNGLTSTVLTIGKTLKIPR